MVTDPSNSTIKRGSFPLSVVIPTHSLQAPSLASCLKALHWCSDILLLQSGSDDLPLQLQKDLPQIRIEKVRWEGYTKTKEKGFQKTLFPWILWLDSDEILSPELIKSIQNIDQEKVNVCYAFRRQNFFLGKKVSFSKHQKDWVTRLFYRNKVFFDHEIIHERLQPQANVSVKKLTGLCYHATILSYEQWLQKTLKYARLTAYSTQTFPHQKNLLKIKLFLLPYLVFLNYFIIHLGFLDGFLGLEISRFASLKKHLKIKFLLEGLKLQSKPNSEWDDPKVPSQQDF